MHKYSRNELAHVKDKVNLYLELNRYIAAEKLLLSTLEDYGNIANVRNLLGVTYHMQSKFVDAIREFNAALSINPEFVEAALNMSVVFCDLGMYEDAQNIFSVIDSKIQNKKKQPVLVLGRIANQHAKNGQSYQSANMSTAAIQEYRKALSLYSDMPDVQLKLAKLYINSNQPEKAKQELEGIISNYDADIKQDKEGTKFKAMWEANIWLGILYHKLDKNDKAKQYWQKARQIAPEQSTAIAYSQL